MARVEDAHLAAQDLLDTLSAHTIQVFDSEDYGMWPGMEGIGHVASGEKVAVLFDHHTDTGTIEISVSYPDGREFHGVLDLEGIN